MHQSRRSIAAPLIATALFGAVGLPYAALYVWSSATGRAPGAIESALGLLLGLTVSPLATWWLWLWARGRGPIIRAAAYSGYYLVWWLFAVYAAQWLEWYSLRASLANYGLGLLFLIGLAWAVWGVEQASQFYANRRKKMEELASGPAEDRAAAAARPRAAEAAAVPDRVWNPLDLDAWYYGRRSKKLSQSLATLTAYTCAFFLALLLASQLSGCREIYEMPAGGGKQATMSQMQQTVRIQKVIKKKFVINPFSSIIFNPPPIDEVKLDLVEVTKHMYSAVGMSGWGEGNGPGFAGGTGMGKVRFIRLEYAGGDWNQDFGIGADLNMLTEYGIRTGQKIHNQTEARTIPQLGNFALGKSPPLVYLTGQRSISLSKSEIKILREYLLDKHGMLFGDNGGSGHFHNQFFAMMQQVLPDVEPVRVPLDDVIHRLPYQLPFLPYVAPHGGKDAWGWKVDGRWVCYYHPGDIGDAWTDDHSGVEPEIWEYCYQLGTNIILYAHVEYSKWLTARQAK